MDQNENQINGSSQPFIERSPPNDAMDVPLMHTRMISHDSSLHKIVSPKNGAHNNANYADLSPQSAMLLDRAFGEETFQEQPETSTVHGRNNASAHVHGKGMIDPYNQ